MNKKIKKNYWEDREWFIRRNQSIMKDKMGGMSMVNLVKKYEITPTRLYYIVYKMKERKQKNQREVQR
jgi:Mor family transcriptional regulator